MQSAPAVEPPERDGDNRLTLQVDPHSESGWVVDGEERDQDTGEQPADDSPQGSGGGGAGVKMTFGVSGRGGGGSGSGGLGKRPLDNVLGEEESDTLAPKKKLASIQQIEKEQRIEKRAQEKAAMKMRVEERKKIPPEERKKMIQTLVSGIPTTKEELFEYDLKWDAIDQVFVCVWCGCI